MFTARDFLEAPPSPSKYRKLPKQLRADPGRLRLEFLDIAIDREERFEFRTTSLTVLSRYADDIGALGSSQVVQRLVIAFEKEFPPNVLDHFAAAIGAEDCDSQAFLAHLFCIVFAKLAPAVTEKHITAVQKALKGTSLEPILAEHLATIKRNRGSID